MTYTLLLVTALSVAGRIVQWQWRLDAAVAVLVISSVLYVGSVLLKWQHLRRDGEVCWVLRLYGGSLILLSRPLMLQSDDMILSNFTLLFGSVLIAGANAIDMFDIFLWSSLLYFLGATVTAAGAIVALVWRELLTLYVASTSLSVVGAIFGICEM